MKQIFSQKTLLEHVVELINQIENSQKPIIFQKSINLNLLKLEQVLLNETLDIQELSQCANGIFRLVTESAKLEQSPIGTELLSLLSEIHLLEASKKKP